MNHAHSAVAARVPPVSGWILHSGGRQFGPLTEDELRRFFSSGVVKHGDILVHPDFEGGLPAQEVALKLQVAAPVAVAAPLALDPPVRHLVMEPATHSGQRALLLLALALALGVYYWTMPQPSLEQDAPVELSQAGTNTVRYDEPPARVADAALSSAPKLPPASPFATPPHEPVAQPAARATATQASPTTAAAAAGFQPAPVAASMPARDAWLDEAQRLEEAKDWVSAHAHARRWVEREPRRGHSWWYLGRAQRELGGTNAALGSFARAADMMPNEFWIAANLGGLYEQTRDFGRAEAQYRRAIGIRSDYAHAWGWLGRVLVAQNRNKEAIAAWEQAARLDSGNFERWDALCYNHQRYGDKARALQACDKAVALNPRDGYAKGLAEWIRTH